MKIIIKESQIKFLNEDLSTINNVSYELKESIAVWCLINDFRFFLPNNVFGRKISVANSENINKEICADIINGTLTKTDEEKEIFGYNDYDDFEENDDEREEYMRGYSIYKVETVNETYYIEVPNNIPEYFSEELLQKLEDGELNDYDSELIGWFNEIYR